LNVKFGQKVEVKVDHKLEENYVPPPKKPIKPFEGQGQRLGSIISPSTSSSPTSQTMPGAFPTTTTSSSSSSISPTTTSGSALTIDPSQPTTSLQIRLVDGTRLVAKFNHHHTIGDVRRFINS